MPRPQTDAMKKFIAEALEADAQMSATGEAYAAKDVHDWLLRLATDRSAQRPKPIALTRLPRLKKQK
jgi:hypothetical protein